MFESTGTRDGIMSVMTSQLLIIYSLDEEQLSVSVSEVSGSSARQIFTSRSSWHVVFEIVGGKHAVEQYFQITQTMSTYPTIVAGMLKASFASVGLS